MKMTEYLRILGIGLVAAPIVLCGFLVLCIGSLLKAAGYVLLGELDMAKAQLTEGNTL